MIRPDLPIIEGDICIEGKYIFSVGKEERDFQAERIIDCNKNLVMSGFCNAHTHAAMSLFRGIADDLSLQDWLFERIFPMEDRLTPDDVYWGTMLQVAE